MSSAGVEKSSWINVSVSLAVVELGLSRNDVTWDTVLGKK